MNKDKQPGISFDSIILKSLEFMRKPEIDEKRELDIGIKYGKAIDANKKKLTCEINLSIKQENKSEQESSFVIKCGMVGFFSIIEEEANMDIEKFSEVNAPAAMFPFLREIVADVTARSGIRPVLLPPLNLVSLIRDDSASVD